MSIDELENAVTQLSREEQISLVDRITAHLVEPLDPEVESAWAAAAEERLDEMLEGKVEGIPADVVLSEMRKRLNERNNISSAGPEGG